MTFGRKKTHVNPGNGSSDFFMDPEEASLLGFSIDDTLPEQEEVYAPKSQKSVWAALFILAMVLIGGEILLWRQINQTDNMPGTENSQFTALEQRLFKLEQDLQNTPPLQGESALGDNTPALAEVTITSTSDSLTANGRDQSQLTISLKDSSGNPYSQPTQITAYMEGGGTLLAGGRDVNGIPITVNGTSNLNYQAGLQPGIVVIHVRVDGVAWEYTRLLHLEPVLPQRLELSLEPENLPLIADGETTATLLVRLFDETNQLLPGVSDVSLNVSQEGLVDISSEPPYIAHNGELALEITAKDDLVDSAEITLEASVGIISERISLRLVPNYSPPDLKARLGFLCTVLDNDETSRLFRNGVDGTGQFLEIPKGSEVGCSEDGGRMRESSVVIWLPAASLNSEITSTLTLTLTQPITVYLGLEMPSSTEDVPLELDIAANGLRVYPTGREDGEFVEVFVNGWMVTAVLETKE